MGSTYRERGNAKMEIYRWLLLLLFINSISQVVSVGANTIIMEITHKEKLNNTFEYY